MLLNRRFSVIFIGFLSILSRIFCTDDLVTNSISIRSEDQFVPSQCNVTSNVLDHLLLAYDVVFMNGSINTQYKSPGQLFHYIIQSNNSYIDRSLIGMCEGGVRRIYWSSAINANFESILVHDSLINTFTDEQIAIEFTLHHITNPKDYELFDAINNLNFTLAMDLINNHQGVNSFDQWGQTALMIAVSNQYLPIFAALLNTYHPKVDVNLAKPNGFTALFYATERAQPEILEALLKKNADPNKYSLAEGSKGNTPLHIACLLEKNKHAELLLKYGANPYAKNEFGLIPIQLLPKDAVKSTKLYFQKIMEEAVNKQRQLSNEL